MRRELFGHKELTSLALTDYEYAQLAAPLAPWANVLVVVEGGICAYESYSEFHLECLEGNPDADKVEWFAAENF